GGCAAGGDLGAAEPELDLARRCGEGARVADGGGQGDGVRLDRGGGRCGDAGDLEVGVGGRGAQYLELRDLTGAGAAVGGELQLDVRDSGGHRNGHRVAARRAEGVIPGGDQGVE